MSLAGIFVLMLPVAVFGQDQFNPEGNVQNAATYFDRAASKEKKGDLSGAMADYDQAIKLNSNFSNAYNNRGSPAGVARTFKIGNRRRSSERLALFWRLIGRG